MAKQKKQMSVLAKVANDRAPNEMGKQFIDFGGEHVVAVAVGMVDGTTFTAFKNGDEVFIEVPQEWSPRSDVIGMAEHIARRRKK